MTASDVSQRDIPTDTRCSTLINVEHHGCGPCTLSFVCAGCGQLRYLTYKHVEDGIALLRSSARLVVQSLSRSSSLLGVTRAERLSISCACSREGSAQIVLAAPVGTSCLKGNYNGESDN